jgi:polygalacturonase
MESVNPKRHPSLNKLIVVMSLVTCNSIVGFTTDHYEAEQHARQSGCTVSTQHFPYIGNGYLDMGGIGSFVEWDSVEAGNPGDYSLLIKYANGSGADRPCQLTVNDSVVDTIAFSSKYTEWTSYWNARAVVELHGGANTIRLTSLTESGGPNIDNIAISSDGHSTPPGALFNVRDFGAAGDGATNDTRAIQAAIDACADQGCVVLSNGIFMSGNIRLKSNMTLWIDATATLRAIQDNALFPATDPPTNNVSVHDELGESFIYSEGADNLLITGGGTVDGNGECAIWDKSHDESKRPVPIYVTQGTNITITNLDIIRGAMWNLVPLECDSVVIDGININSTYGMNKDGIDPCDCHHVSITNCALTVEDDALCPKSGHARGVEDVSYRNITVNRTVCGMIKLGTKSYGHFRNLIFEDLALTGARTDKDPNVAINLSTVDGADIYDVTVRRVKIRSAATGVFILHGAGGRALIPSGDSFKRGSVEKILIEDIEARETFDSFGNFVNGTRLNDTTYWVKDVTIKNVKIHCVGGLNTVPAHPVEYTRQYPNYDWCGGDLPAWGFYIRHTQDVRFIDCDLELSTTDARDEYVTENVVGFEQGTTANLPVVLPRDHSSRVEATQPKGARYLVINGHAGSNVHLYSVSGRLVSTAVIPNSGGTVPVHVPGVYLLKVDDIRTGEPRLIQQVMVH